MGKEFMISEMILRICYQCINFIVGILHIPCILTRWYEKSKQCPPITNACLLMPASEVAARIRQKQMTSKEIVQAYIERIKEVNPIINAVIENRFEQALEEAKKVDDFVKESNKGEDYLKNVYPLLGVPFTIKGSIAVKGMRHTAGRRDIDAKATEDAIAVRNVRKAGAIPLLISNVPELCLSWDSANKLVGCTVNPYDSRRTSGGSSGGEASLLGCGASLIGIGSDIGGSLRLPANFCGVYSHKPSPLVVSTIGHYPTCKNEDIWNQVFTLGPMARYATDLKFLLKAMAEPNNLKLDEPIDVKKIKIYYLYELQAKIGIPFDTEAQMAVQKIIQYFDRISEDKASKLNLPLMNYCFELSFTSLTNIENVETVLDGKKVSPYLEMVKKMFGLSAHQFTSILYIFLQRHRNLLLPTHLNAVMCKLLDELKQQFLDILGENSVLILPTSPHEAFYKKETLRHMWNNGHLSIFNSLGFPVTHCPVMKSRNGLPIGVQVVAGPNCDHLSLNIAEEIEKAFGTWQFPSQ